MTINIDGSVLEGGGQILRNSITYAALLKIPLTIRNIRAKRNNPGLAPQHVSSIELVKNMCHSTVTGNSKGSTQIAISDSYRCVSNHVYRCDCGTAGSISLMIQAAYLAAVFADNGGLDSNVGSANVTTLDLIGGTDVSHSPSIGYINSVLRIYLRMFNIIISTEVITRGFFPKGGGRVRCHVQSLPTNGCIKPIKLVDRGTRIISIEGIAYTSGTVRDSVASTMSKTANEKLFQFGIWLANSHDEFQPVKVAKLDRSAAVGNGSGIHVCVATDTGCVFYANRQGNWETPPEHTANDCVAELREQLSHGGCVDHFLQDQLILPMSLAYGDSFVLCGSPLTVHTKTAIHVSFQLTNAQFTIYDPIPKELEQELSIPPLSPLINRETTPLCDTRILIKCKGINRRAQ